YENFNALSTKSFDSIFNRLQKIVSQLVVLGENISQEDLNMKFLRNLPAERNTHVVVWRNKSDIYTMSFDDLYKNFKIVKQEVKRTVVSCSSSGSLNMAFLSSLSSTNELDTASIQRTGKKITINENDTAGYDKTKVECFNYHKMGHFAREYQSPRSKESRPRNQDSSRKTVIVEDTSSKAMVAIDGLGFDWSYLDDDEVPTNMALMAFSDSEIESKDFVLRELKFSYICFRSVFCVFFVASLPLNLALVTGPDIVEVEVPSAFVVILVLTGAATLEELCLAVLIGTIPDLVKTTKTSPFSQTIKNMMQDLLLLRAVLKEMCDKKNNVLFTETECLILSPDFKLPDKN
nr:hypothetical protein [Tanacetum cinerariifolium]